MVEDLAKTMVVGALLQKLLDERGGYELIDHWTNCNGGIKEVLAFDDVPDRWALWHHRCPANREFSGELARIRARATTDHYFDLCALLTHDARSELLPEHRERMRGGGW